MYKFHAVKLTHYNICTYVIENLPFFFLFYLLKPTALMRPLGHRCIGGAVGFFVG